MFDFSMMTPERITQLAMVADPAPVLQQLSMQVNPQQQFGTQSVAQGPGGFSNMIFGSVAPTMPLTAPWDPKNGPDPTKLGGAAPLNPQQMAILQRMMQPNDPRMPNAPSGGIPGRPGQIQFSPVFPASKQQQRPVPSLGQLIGR